MGVRWSLALLFVFVLGLVGGCGSMGEDEATELTGRIEGTVTPPSEDVQIHLFHNSQQIATTTVDADGNYAFDDIQPGNYEIQVVALNHQPVLPARVDITEGKILSRDFTLDPLASVLRGLVIAPDGSAIAGATVTLNSAQGELTQETDVSGVFSFDNVWFDTELTLIVSAEGMEEQTLAVSGVARGETAKLQVELTSLSEEPATGSQVGDIAPDFTLPHVDGEMISLSDYRGDKTVLLSFHRGQF